MESAFPSLTASRMFGRKAAEHLFFLMMAAEKSWMYETIWWKIVTKDSFRLSGLYTQRNAVPITVFHDNFVINSKQKFKCPLILVLCIENWDLRLGTYILQKLVLNSTPFQIICKCFQVNKLTVYASSRSSTSLSRIRRLHKWISQHFIKYIQFSLSSTTAQVFFIIYLLNIWL